MGKITLVTLILLAIGAMAIYPLFQSPTHAQSAPRWGAEVMCEKTSIAVSTSGLTTLYDLYTYFTTKEVSVEVCNTGTNAVTAFAVQRKVHPNAAFSTWLSATDFDAASANLVYCDTNGPQEIDSNACANFDIVPRAVYALRFQAQIETGDGSNGTLSIRAGVKPE